LDVAGYFMFVRGILIVVLFGVFIRQTDNLNISLLVVAISCVLLSGIIELFVHHKIAEKDNAVISIKKTFGIIKGCFPLFIASVVPIVITAYPRIVLEKYYGSELLGCYGNVSTPSLLITTLAPVVLVALLPAYGVAFNSVDKRKIKKLWILSIIGCLVFGSICFLGLLVLAKPLLSLIYTEQIVPYVVYIYPITVAMVIYSFTMCNYTALIAIRKKTMIIVSALIALLVCLILSGFLIKSYSIKGAIAVLIITYLVQFVIQMVCLLIAVNNIDKKT
jgi:O-antigen/teichoic acid export membrane protein